MRISALFAAALLLAGCSSDNPRLDLKSSFAGLKKSVVGEKADVATASPFASLTRAQLKGVEGPLLVVHLESTGGYAAFGRAASNRGVETFATQEQVTLDFRGGVLVASRGFAGDLMSSDSKAATAAIVSGSAGNYQRSYFWMDGNEQTRATIFDCTLSFVDSAKVEIVEHVHKANHWRESCKNAAQTVSNDYWVSLDGSVIWQSRQMISAEVGYINVTRLIR